MGPATLTLDGRAQHQPASHEGAQHDQHDGGRPTSPAQRPHASNWCRGVGIFAPSLPLLSLAHADPHAWLAPARLVVSLGAPHPEPRPRSHPSTVRTRAPSHQARTARSLPARWPKHRAKPTTAGTDRSMGRPPSKIQALDRKPSHHGRPRLFHYPTSFLLLKDPREERSLQA